MSDHLNYNFQNEAKIQEQFGRRPWGCPPCPPCPPCHCPRDCRDCRQGNWRPGGPGNPENPWPWR